jgi:hypothetical protein
MIATETALKASDLRVGNWVELKNSGFIKIDIDNIGDVVSNLAIFKPIELTPELLEKAGFEYHSQERKYEIAIEYHKKIGDRFGHIEKWTIGSKSEYKMSVGDHRFVTLKYVHQLQNLYYVLTGQELEINLS